MSSVQLSRYERFGFALVFVALILTTVIRPMSVNAAVEYNQRIPFADDFDACTGERVLISGIQHIVGRFTRDHTGRLHFGFSRNTYGTGVGQVSGASYRLIDSVHRSSFEVTLGVATVFTEGFQALLLRNGETSPNDDSIVHFLSKITINATGDVTASIEIQRAECR